MQTQLVQNGRGTATAPPVVSGPACRRPATVRHDLNGLDSLRQGRLAAGRTPRPAARCRWPSGCGQISFAGTRIRSPFTGQARSTVVWLEV